MLVSAFTYASNSSQIVVESNKSVEIIDWAINESDNRIDRALGTCMFNVNLYNGNGELILTVTVIYNNVNTQAECDYIADHYVYANE